MQTSFSFPKFCSPKMASSDKEELFSRPRPVLEEYKCQYSKSRYSKPKTSLLTMKRFPNSTENQMKSNSIRCKSSQCHQRHKLNALSFNPGESRRSRQCSLTHSFPHQGTVGSKFLLGRFESQQVTGESRRLFGRRRSPLLEVCRKLESYTQARGSDQMGIDSKGAPLL